MTRKSNAKAKAAPGRTKVKFQGFLSVTLNKQEKQYVKDNPLGDEELVQFLGDTAFNGYKISVSFQQHQDCYTVTAYGTRFNHPDAGYALSIRHRNFVTAFTALHWCLAQAGKDGSLFAWLGEDDELDW